MLDPFEPQSAIISGALYGGNYFIKTLPASSLNFESSPLIYDSRVSSALQPGFNANFPFSYY
jgi:hypothetical protein